MPVNTQRKLDSDSGDCIQQKMCLCLAFLLYYCTPIPRRPAMVGTCRRRDQKYCCCIVLRDAGNSDNPEQYPRTRLCCTCLCTYTPSTKQNKQRAAYFSAKRIPLNDIGLHEKTNTGCIGVSSLFSSILFGGSFNGSNIPLTPVILQEPNNFRYHLPELCMS